MKDRGDRSIGCVVAHRVVLNGQIASPHVERVDGEVFDEVLFEKAVVGLHLDRIGDIVEMAVRDRDAGRAAIDGIEIRDVEPVVAAPLADIVGG